MTATVTISLPDHEPVVIGHSAPGGALPTLRVYGVVEGGHRLSIRSGLEGDGFSVATGSNHTHLEHTLNPTEANAERRAMQHAFIDGGDRSYWLETLQPRSQADALHAFWTNPAHRWTLVGMTGDGVEGMAVGPGVPYAPGVARFGWGATFMEVGPTSMVMCVGKKRYPFPAWMHETYPVDLDTAELPRASEGEP